MFKALGDPTRLRIFEFLRACSCPVALGETGDVSPVEGATVGEVCCQVLGTERPTSTLSFHLKELRNAGLIETEKRGQHVVCRLDPEAVRNLAEYFTTPPDCC